MFNIDLLVGDSCTNSVCEYVLIISTVYSFSKIKAVKKVSHNFKLLIFLLSAFSLFYSPDNGDSFTSQFIFSDFQMGVDISELHFEPIYFMFMKFSLKSYVVWRLIVWGFSILLFYLLMKRLGCDSYISLFVWSVLGIHSFYYQRIVLGLGILFWSVISFISYLDKKSLITLILSIVLFVISYFFHRTMPIYMSLSLFVLIIITYNKSIFTIIGLIVVPFILIALLDNVHFIVHSLPTDLSMMSEIYLDSSRNIGDFNLNATIFNFIRWAPFSVMMLYCLYIYVKYPNSLSIYERYFLISSVLLYFLYFLLQGRVAFSFASKMKMQSVITMTLFLSIYLTNRIHLKSSCCYVYYAFVSFALIQLYNLFF